MYIYIYICVYIYMHAYYTHDRLSAHMLLPTIRPLLYNLVKFLLPADADHLSCGPLTPTSEVNSMYAHIFYFVLCARVQ